MFELLAEKTVKENIMTQDEYFDEQEEQEKQAEKDYHNYAGGYEAAKGDYEGACLARAEYEGGAFD